MSEDKGSTEPSHDAGTRKGEDITSSEGKEPGRHDSEGSGAGRPSGESTARDSTRINPDNENPIDDRSPNLPPA